MRGIPRIVRNRLRPDQILALVKHRYGSTDRFDGEVLPYAQIAQVSGVAAATVRNNILRFHRQGNKAIRRKQTGRKAAIPEDIQLKMVSRETLNDLRFLPMRVRAQRHALQYGFPVSLYQLKMVYKRHKVRFRQPKLSSRLPEGKELALIPERIFFAERMK